MNTYVLAFSCVLLIGQAKAQSDTPPPPPWRNLPLDVRADMDVICDAKERAEADFRVGISGMMDYDDLLRLLVWNHKFFFFQGAAKPNYPEINWKRDVLMRLQDVFVATCPSDFVPVEFLHATRELFMIYQNSINETVNHEEEWKAFLPMMTSCVSKLEKFDMISTGFRATGIRVKTKTGDTEDIAIVPPVETADGIPDIDVIIDTWWWVFSHFFGSCYWTATDPSIWASRFKRLFYTDFLLNLKDRWLHSGPTTDFGAIIGDYNLPMIISNIRVCVTSAYTKNGLADRQLVRSISLAPSHLGVEVGLNKKIGAVV